MNKHNVKTINGILTLFAVGLALILISCNEDVSPPTADMTILESSINIGDSAHFIITGEADYLTIWTGDSTHNYSEFLDETSTGDTSDPEGPFKHRNSGTSLTSGTEELIYIYKKAGNYEVVLIATNTSYNTESTERKVIKKPITIN